MKLKKNVIFLRRSVRGPGVYAFHALCCRSMSTLTAYGFVKLTVDASPRISVRFALVVLLTDRGANGAGELWRVPPCMSVNDIIPATKARKWSQLIQPVSLAPRGSISDMARWNRTPSLLESSGSISTNARWNRPPRLISDWLLGGSISASAPSKSPLQQPITFLQPRRSISTSSCWNRPTALESDSEHQKHVFSHSCFSVLLWHSSLSSFRFPLMRSAFGLPVYAMYEYFMGSPHLHYDALMYLWFW